MDEESVNLAVTQHQLEEIQKENKLLKAANKQLQDKTFFLEEQYQILLDKILQRVGRYE